MTRGLQLKIKFEYARAFKRYKENFKVFCGVYKKLIDR